MNFDVRPMALHETDLIIDYFHSATPEHLEMLGVDPTRLFPIASWRNRYMLEYSLPIESRNAFMVIWLEDDHPFGFSSVDKIAFGDEAHMHLHIVDGGRRSRGFGVQCVRKSIDIYFEQLKLKRLFCEPNAFNVAPNRTLQQVGFKYLKTHKTVPAPSIFIKRSIAGCSSADLSGSPKKHVFKKIGRLKTAMMSPSAADQTYDGIATLSDLRCGDKRLFRSLRNPVFAQNQALECCYRARYESIASLDEQGLDPRVGFSADLLAGSRSSRPS